MTKQEVLAKLNSVISTEKSQWFEQAKYREENHKDIKKAQKIALIVLRTIRARKMSQKTLAEKIGTTPQLVNKWLKGKENFTLGTIDKLERALDIELVHIVQPKLDFKVIKLDQKTIYTQATTRTYKTSEYGVVKMAPKSKKKEIEIGLTTSFVAESQVCYG